MTDKIVPGLPAEDQSKQPDSNLNPEATASNNENIQENSRPSDGESVETKEILQPEEVVKSPDNEDENPLSSSLEDTDTSEINATEESTTVQESEPSEETAVATPEEKQPETDKSNGTDMAKVEESEDAGDQTEKKNISEESDESNISRFSTKEEILKRVQEILELSNLPPRSETESLKQAFYRLKSSETELLKTSFLESGGNMEDFVVEPDPLEEEFKSVLNKIKEKRASLSAAEEKEKEDNYKKKLEIIDKIKVLTESTDDFGKLYKEFQLLQQEWKEIKEIPQGKEKDLWRSYQIYTEKFYDLLKINNELRDYDFKKNLELKNAIIESVEKLEHEPDVISAFHQLQKFHQQWRDIGPVAKDLRDEVWEKFKKSSGAINKRYQEHFISLKASEETNLAEKTAICETLKGIDYSAISTPKDWDQKTKEVIALQEKWKTIGFVPRKVNTQIFEEFRKLCDEFFDKKAEFFKAQKSELEANLEKKRALCERAKELKDSTDWKETANELISIQKEWKKVGPIPRKHSDALWKEFVGACDYFFEQRNKVVDSKKGEELQNLAAKKGIIEKINALDTGLEPDEFMSQMRALMDEWHKIGFVPFREKDKIYKEYQSALDVHFDRLKMNRTERRMQNFKSNLEDISKSERPKGKLLRERDKLMAQYNRIKSDLQTYENNMGFLSLSKGSGGLLKDMNAKIEDLKNEMDMIAKKIDTIDESMQQIEE